MLVNKAQLIDAMVESSDLTKAVAGQALDAFIGSVSKALASGESVVLVNFGNFSVKSRAARTGRNPKTGQPIQIAASLIPTFKAGKLLKDAVAMPAEEVKEEEIA